jgi:hypothetical protein
MRLNIRYSVEEDNLLNEVHNLFLKAHDKFGQAKDLVIRQMLHSTTLREHNKMLTSIDDLRKAMLSFDTSLSEIMAILEGYDLYKRGELPQQFQQETEDESDYCGEDGCKEEDQSE